MREESYIVNIGILNKGENSYYDLKESNTTHVLFNDYIKCQKYLFRIIDHYHEFEEEYRSRVMIWLDIHQECNDIYTSVFERSYYQTYFYYYRGIRMEGKEVYLDDPSRYISDIFDESIEIIRHYIPKGYENNYKQAKMEYKLMNK